MANRALFATQTLPEPTTLNAEGASAYALKPKQALARLAMSGCLNQTFYAGAQAQLDEVLALCFEVPSEFVAKTAIHARERGRMKDMPALLCARLASSDGERLEPIFPRVIDDGRMLRNFVQILRSGAVARKSLGSRPKRLVQQWLEQASDARLIHAMVGQQRLCTRQPDRAFGQSELDGSPPGGRDGNAAPVEQDSRAQPAAKMVGVDLQPYSNSFVAVTRSATNARGTTSVAGSNPAGPCGP